MTRPYALWSAVVLVVALTSRPAPADDKGDALAKAAAEQFAKALVAEDIDALLKVADVPWWWDEKRITTDRDDLRKQLRSVLDAQDFTDEKLTVGTIAPLADFEKATGKTLPAARRKKLEEVLGPDHRLVSVGAEKGDRKGKGVLAVRIKDGKARVVGIVEF